MAYREAIGELSLRYLLVKINDLPLFERKEGPVFFLKSYDDFFNRYLQRNGWVCRFMLPAYSRELAVRAYGTLEEKAELKKANPCFLWMSFVYVTCISMDTPFDIGLKRSDLLCFHAKMDCTKAELAGLLREVTNRIWMLQLREQDNHLLLAS
jgi:hypothetical protein